MEDNLVLRPKLVVNSMTIKTCFVGLDWFEVCCQKWLYKLRISRSHYSLEIWSDGAVNLLSCLSYS